MDALDGLLVLELEPDDVDAEEVDSEEVDSEEDEDVD